MNKLEINIPEGMEIDWEASAKQKQIVLKNKYKQFTYKDVCEKLFKNGHYFMDKVGLIYESDLPAYDPNAATYPRQLKCILAKNKLANVAVYLNDGWKPDLESDCGYGITLDYDGNLSIDHCGVLCPFSSGKVIFKSKKLAQEAIEILGKETVKLALTPLY